MTTNLAARRSVSLAGTTAGVCLLLMLQGKPDLGGAHSEGGQASNRAWPLWGGTAQRNMVNLLETKIATDWNSRPGQERNIKWSVDLGSRAYGGPVVSGGKIFVGTNNARPRDRAVRGDKGVLLCLRESDGAFLWQMVRDKLDSGRVNDWPDVGICSTPVVEGNRLWYVSNRCEVICATTEGLAAGNVGPFRDEKYRGKRDGDIVWSLDMIKELGVFPHNQSSCSPLIAGNRLFVITSNGVDESHLNIPAPGAPSFLAIDKVTGKVLWSSSLPGRNILHGQWSSPVYAVAQGKPQVIFPGGDGCLYSFNPRNGTLLWKFDCNPRGAVYRPGPNGTRNTFLATPVIWANKLYVGVGDDPEHKKGVGHLWCIDITKTPADRQTRDLSPWSDPKVEIPARFDLRDPKNRDSGLVWHYGGVAAAAAAGNFIFGRTLSTCAVHEELVYACEYGGVLHCLDAHTGNLYWKANLGANTWSSPYLVGGHVYVGTDAGEMHIFRHARARKLVNKIQMKGKIRATPVACNGVLYVITEGPCKLWAIQTR